MKSPVTKQQTITVVIRLCSHNHFHIKSIQKLFENRTHIRTGLDMRKRMSFLLLFPLSLAHKSSLLFFFLATFCCYCNGFQSFNLSSCFFADCLVTELQWIVGVVVYRGGKQQARTERRGMNYIVQGYNYEALFSNELSWEGLLLLLNVTARERVSLVIMEVKLGARAE